LALMTSERERNAYGLVLLEPCASEYEIVVKSLKMNKCPGMDQIS